MPNLETLTEKDLIPTFRPPHLHQARRHLDNIRNPVRQGSQLHAQVEDGLLYDVIINVSSNDIQATCSCPYDWNGYCQHAAALLLKWIDEPQAFTVEEIQVLDREYPIDVVPVEPPPSWRPDTPPFWITSSLEDWQKGMDRELVNELSEMRIQDLREMAKHRGWDVKGTSKAKIVSQLVEHLLQPGEQMKAFHKLDEEHKSVFRGLALLDVKPTIVAEELERMASLWCTPASYKSIWTYLRHLHENGMALSGSMGNFEERNDFVPGAFLRVMDPLLEDIFPKLEFPPSDAGGLFFADPYSFMRTVGQILLLLEHSPVPLRPPMPRPQLEALAPGLASWDYVPEEIAEAQKRGKLRSYSDLLLTIPPPRRSLPDEAIRHLGPIAGGEAQLEFIYTLLVSAGLLLPGSPVTPWKENVERFLALSEQKQRSILTRTYFSLNYSWNPMWEVLRANPNLQLVRVYSHRFFQPKHLLSDLMRFQHLVFNALAALPNDEWIGTRDIIRLMRVVWPQFDNSVWKRDSYSSLPTSWFLYSTRNERALHPADPHDWEVAQGEFIRTLLTHSLHWLGLTDLSFDGEDLVAVRFHDLSDLYWYRVESPPFPRPAMTHTLKEVSEETISVDDRTISLRPSAISAQAHSLLDKIARLDVVTGERFVYRLDPQAAYKAFEEGIVLSEVVEQWQELLPVPLPAGMLEQLEHWWASYGRVRIYEDLTVIEFADEYTLAEMKAVTSLEEYLIAEISPRLVIISEEGIETLTEELEKAGYTPKQTHRV